MKIKHLFLIFILLLVLTGCNNTTEETTESEDIALVPDTQATEVIEPEYDEPEYYEEDHHDNSSHIQFEYIDEDHEGSDIGNMITEESDDIPDYLVGTWYCTQGLPEGLTSYSLTIYSDGIVTQETEDESGAVSYTDSTLVLSGDELILTNDYNLSLMVLYYNNGQLLSDSLGPERALFSR